MSLHFVSAFGLAEDVETFLNEGADINAEFKGKTALCLAIENNKEKVVEILLRRGSDIQKRYNDMTYLHIAVNSSKPNLKIIKHLINYGVSVNAVSSSDHFENYTPLHFAVLQGHEDIVNLLVSKGAVVNLTGKHGESPLHIAAEKGHLQLVELFVMHNVLIDSCTLPSYRSVTTHNFSNFQCPSAVKSDNLCTIDFTPLHLAVLYGKYDVVKFLLDHGANVNAQDSDGKTALHIAVELGNSLLIKLILSYNLDIENRGNKNALVDAIILYDQDSELTQLLIDRGLNIGTEYINNINLLNAVVKKGWFRILIPLVHYGADVDSTDIHNNGFSLLHTAVDNGSKDSCELLLYFNANVNIKDNDDKNPIFYAIQNGDFAIVKLLLDREASIEDNIIEAFNTAIEKECFPVIKLVLQHKESFDINAADSFGRTPLLSTSLTKGDALLENLYDDRDPKMVISCDDNVREQIAKFLLVRGANVNVCLKNGMTPLFAAAKNGFKQVINTLLEYNIDVSQLCDGCSALHVAVRENNVEIVEILLRSGCDVDARDKCCITPIHIAAAKGFLNIVKLLLRYGANYKLIDNTGQTAFYLACKEGHKEVVEYLLKHFHTIRNSSENQYAGANILSCDISYVTGEHEFTPLAVAVINGFENIVEMILQWGFDANYINGSYKTALHIASYFGIARRKSKVIIKLLIKFGANLKSRDMNGQTALHIACQIGQQVMVRSLLESFYGIEVSHEYCTLDFNFLEFVNSKDDDQLTALMIAVKNGLEETITMLLLKYGADPNIVNNSGRIALHFACETANFCYLKILLMYGSDINILTNEGFNAINCAVTGIYKVSTGQQPVCISCVTVQRNRRFVNYDILKEKVEKLVHNHDFRPCVGDELASFFENVVDTLQEHMVKLFALDPLLLNESNLNFLRSTYEGVIQGEFFLSCKRELELTPTYHIINRISFYDLLKKNFDVLGVYMNNQTFVNSLDAIDYQKFFPLYCCVVFGRLKNGRRKFVLRQECVNCLYSPSIWSDFSKLPVTCTENIVVYLTVNDMNVLLNACRFYE